MLAEKTITTAAMNGPHTHTYTHKKIQYMQVNKFGVVKNGWRKESTQ